MIQALMEFLPRNAGVANIGWIKKTCGDMEKEHPEYFTLDDKGQRVFGHQRCLSNPDCRKLLKERYFRRMGEFTRPSYVDLSAGDTPGRFCNCPGCLALEIVDTRIEGKCRKFVAALVNADGCDGFTVTGPGVIDGNGYRAWRSAVMRHEWSGTAVNLDEQRARLLYVARSKNVRIENVRLQNPQFWTQHFWDCENVRLIGVTVYSPSGPEGHVKSCTDALDLDETRNVLVRNCRFACNDDAIAIKGTDGAAVERVLIEDSAIGFCHGALVLGSEAKRVRNVLMRRCTMDHAMRVLWIKFRADMAQHYDYVTVEDVKGSSEWFFFARQFSDNRDRRTRLTDEELAARRSVADHFTMHNCRIDCREFFHMTVTPDVGTLSDFSFTDLDVCGENITYDLSGIERCDFRDVKLAERPWTGRRHGVGPVKRPKAVQ
mgnify:CR=1 FL=1